MFDVIVVSILKFLKLAEDGFHKLREGYGIYVVLKRLLKWISALPEVRMGISPFVLRTSFS